MEVPGNLVDLLGGGQRFYIVTTVLPMGFLNSVAIAQHVHRNVVRQCRDSLRPPLGAEAEIRRDKVASSSTKLKLVDRATAD